MAKTSVAISEDPVRTARWRTFQILFVLTCAAIVLDISTTYLGFQREGSRFEQNGIVLYLIQHIGWAGVCAILIFACAACFRSFKTVYWNLSTRWSMWLNLFLIAVCGFRWLVALSDTIWLMH